MRRVFSFVLHGLRPAHYAGIPADAAGHAIIAGPTYCIRRS